MTHAKNRDPNLLTIPEAAWLWGKGYNELRKALIDSAELRDAITVPNIGKSYNISLPNLVRHVFGERDALEFIPTWRERIAEYRAEAVA